LKNPEQLGGEDGYDMYLSAIESNAISSQASSIASGAHKL